MKKILLSAIALFSLALVSCGGGNAEVYNKAMSIITEHTAAIENATSAEEVQVISQEMGAAISAIVTTGSFSEKEDADIAAAAEKFNAAAEAKLAEVMESIAAYEVEEEEVEE